MPNRSIVRNTPDQENTQKKQDAVDSDKKEIDKIQAVEWQTDMSLSFA